MRRLRELGSYQKVLLVLLALMLAAFSVLYPITLRREGVEYEGALLTVTIEGDTVRYSGKLEGEAITFLVTGGNQLLFQKGEKSYGPYIVKEDRSAAPRDEVLYAQMTGLELYRADELIFRGGVIQTGDSFLLYQPEGGLYSDPDSVSIMGSDGVLRDEAGNVKDLDAPSTKTVLRMMNGPALTHRGSRLGWFCGVFLSLAAGIAILFAEELFRWELSWKIREPEQAVASETELFNRSLGQTGLVLAALVVYCIGLRFQ